MDQLCHFFVRGRLGCASNPGQRELVEFAADDCAGLQAEMARLIQAHPAFAEDLADLALLQEKLESARTTASGAD